MSCFASSAEHVSRIVYRAWARVFTPPHTATQSGRGSGDRNAAMTAFDPGESFPLPIASTPASGWPAPTTECRCSAVGNPGSWSRRLARTLP